MALLMTPARVPGAQARCVRRTEARTAAPCAASPKLVPLPHVIRIADGQVTAAQVERLREENRALRRELARLRRL